MSCFSFLNVFEVLNTIKNGPGKGVGVFSGNTKPYQASTTSHGGLLAAPGDSH